MAKLSEQELRKIENGVQLVGHCQECGLWEEQAAELTRAYRLLLELEAEAQSEDCRMMELVIRCAEAFEK